MILLKRVALATVLTIAGVAASQRRDHLQLQGPVTNCDLGPTVCQQNATHILFSNQGIQTLMVKGPDGSYTLDAEHGDPLGNQPSLPPPPEAPAQPGTPPRARPETPSPAQASSSKFPLDAVVGPAVAFTIFATIGCALFQKINRSSRNRIPITGIITNESNVVSQPPGWFSRNILSHLQPVFNAIPTPTYPPLFIGTTGVLLDPQHQQPHPGPVASSAPQQTSNSGQDLHLQPVGASLVFAGPPLASHQQPALGNPDNAPQASAPSRTPSPSPSSTQSSPGHTDIPPGPPPQYR